MGITASYAQFAHVGTTYKRALTKKIPVRDQVVSDRPAHKGAFGQATRYHLSSDKHLEMTMRKPKDFDAQLKTLAEKAKALKDNKLHRLGELVVATGADTIDMETLAGGLLAMTAPPALAQRAT